MSRIILPTKDEKTAYLKEQIRGWLKETSFMEFYDYFTDRIIGQPELKRLCYCVYSYLQSVAYDRPVNANVLLAGPSGSGKTEFYRVLRSYFTEPNIEIPVSCVDLSQITSAGYRGAEPNEILKSQLQHKNGACEIGVIFCDECDKRLQPSWAGGGSGRGTSNVAMEVQGNLLKIVEGCDVNVPGYSTIDTSNLMFIGMGSFDHFKRLKLEKEKRNQTKQVGFLSKTIDTVETASDVPETLDIMITKTDIVAGGAMPELLGRFSTVINFSTLSEDHMDRLVEKVRQDVEETMPYTQLNLEPEMISYLKSEVKTSEFGTRYLFELIKEATLTASIDFYTSEEACNKEPDDVLVITLYDKDRYDLGIRKMTYLEKADWQEYEEADACCDDDYSDFDDMIDDGLKHIH